MIEIRVGNTLIPVYGASRISFRGITPLLSRSVKPGIRNLPFRGPLTDEVIRLFGLQSHIHQSSVPDGLPCRVRLRSGLFFSGTLHLLSADRQSAEYRITDLTQDFYTEFGEKKLADLAFGSVTIARSTRAKMVFQFNSAVVGKSYNFRVNGNPNTYTVVSGDTPTTIADKLRDKINGNDPGYASSSAGELTVEQPTLADPFLMGWEPTPGTGNYTVVSKMTTADARWTDFLAHIDDVRANNANYDYAFPMIYNPALYDGQNSQWLSWINYYEGGFKRNSTFTLSKEWEYTYIPMWKVKAVLDQLFSDAGYDPPVHSLYTLFNDLIIYNLSPIDEMQQEWMEANQAFGWTNSFAMSINPGDHLGDISVADFLRSLEITFNFLWDFDRKEKIVRIRPVKPIVNSRPGTDIEAMLGGAPTVKLPARPTLILRHKQQADDYASATDLSWQEYTYAMDKEETTLQSELGSILTRDINTLAGGSVSARVPAANHPGNSAILEINNEVVPRLLWYRGMYPDSGGNNYPYASYDDLDSSGVHISGAISLRWDGTYGLIAQYWDDWLEFLKQYRILTFQLIPDRLTLAQLDFFSTLRAFDSLFLLDSYTLRLPADRPMPVSLLRI